MIKSWSYENNLVDDADLVKGPGDMVMHILEQFQYLLVFLKGLRRDRGA